MNEVGTPVDAVPVRDAAPGRARRPRARRWVLLGGHAAWLPAAALVPVEPRFLGPTAWVLLPAGVLLFRAWWRMAELDTWWVMRRRGVTVPGRFESDHGSGSSTAYVVRFRTREGREVTAYGQLGGRRDVVAYDPLDPSVVRASSPWARLGIAVLAFTVPGAGGLLLCGPTVLWAALLPTALV